MKHSTLNENSPRKESINFIRAFARIYSPALNNESQARKMAKAIAQNSMTTC